MPRRRDDVLFDALSPRGPGPVYQGVCRQIRALAESEVLDLLTQAGTVAQARSLARCIDVASGHTGERQANGIPLSAMHDRLDALLARLSGSTAARDLFDDFLDDLAGEDGQDAGAAPLPHPEV